MCLLSCPELDGGLTSVWFLPSVEREVMRLRGGGWGTPRAGLCQKRSDSYNVLSDQVSNLM